MITRESSGVVGGVVTGEATVREEVRIDSGYGGRPGEGVRVSGGYGAGPGVAVRDGGEAYRAAGMHIREADDDGEPSYGAAVLGLRESSRRLRRRAARIAAAQKEIAAL
jgi:hypothetical protein